jgi:hypothetical protein
LTDKIGITTTLFQAAYLIINAIILVKETGIKVSEKEQTV